MCRLRRLSSPHQSPTATASPQGEALLSPSIGFYGMAGFALKLRGATGVAYGETHQTAPTDE